MLANTSGRLDDDTRWYVQETADSIADAMDELLALEAMRKKYSLTWPNRVVEAAFHDVVYSLDQSLSALGALLDNANEPLTIKWSLLRQRIRHHQQSREGALLAAVRWQE